MVAFDIMFCKLVIRQCNGVIRQADKATRLSAKVENCSAQYIHQTHHQHVIHGHLVYISHHLPLLYLQAKNNVSSDTPQVDRSHFEPLGSWTSEKLNASRKENPFMMTWVPGKARDAVPNMTHGK
jgi:hypothetical protein